VPAVRRLISVASVTTLSFSGALPAQQHDKRGGHEAYPAHVLIIRHAEKPPEPSKSVDLTPTGVARAKALPQLFTSSAKGAGPLPRPEFIFAARDTKNSHRPSETAAPLGAALGIPVDTRFTDSDVKALAREILGHRKFEGKTVLIVWHQGTIPDLAKALGATDAPRSWKDSVFDRVWEITYSKNGKVSFEDRPQHLLRGDSAQ
jgi:broad specificity phosphatase PhoE